jgi:hypothetical protein
VTKKPQRHRDTEKNLILKRLRRPSELNLAVKTIAPRGEVKARSL